MREQLIQYNNKHHLFAKGDKIIVGVSGGKDSVCLLHLFNSIKKEYRLSLFVLHVHHEIRGAEADCDADFVGKLADSMGLPFCLVRKNVPSYAREYNMSEEEAGRMIRYQAMEEYRLRMQADKIAIAHHQDDQAETVLFHLFRGSGPRGLAGIPVRRESIIRPLLFASRAVIERYVEENDLGFCQDSTNFVSEYSRNKIRLELLPFVTKEINVQSVRHVAQAAEKVAQWRSYIEEMGRQAFERTISFEPEGIFLSLEKFCREQPVMQDEVLRLVFAELIPGAKDIEQYHYDKIRELAYNETGKIIQLPKMFVAERRYETICFRVQRKNVKTGEWCLACEVPCEHIVNNNGFIYKFSLKVFARNDLPEEIPQKDYTKWFDYDKIKNSLVIRNPREGDYFVMDSQGNHKKLSRYFIDCKMPRWQREQQLVLADDSHIMWVVSGRISQEYKVTEKTKTVLVVTKERTLS